MSHAIELKGVSKTYRTDRIETVALNAIDLAVEQGEMLSIMGPSGCGKSTLLNLMGLLDDPSEGDVCIEGRPMDARGEREQARFRNQHLGFVFQSFHLVPDLSVVDNVEIPLLYRRLPGKERRQRALKALAEVGLTARVDHYPTQLSGGQQQRVAIARAIVGEPRILLADEPTGNLDSATGDDIMTILERLAEGGTTVVMVTHDQKMADRGQRIVRIFDGQIVA